MTIIVNMWYPLKIKTTVMGSKYTFRFRNKDHIAETYFSYEEEPCYIFATLFDESLKREFGEDISLATDCNQLLPGNYDYYELRLLKEALFEAIKDGEEFREIRKRYAAVLNQPRLQRSY